MKFKHLFIALPLLSAVACSGGGKTRIQGSVAGEGEEVIISFLKPEGIKPVDTIALTDSKFSYTLERDSTANFVVVETSDDHYRVLTYIQPGENVEIEVTGEKGNREYTVSGSKESERILKINHIMRDAFDRVDELDSINRSAMDSTNFMEVRKKSDSIRNAVAMDTKQQLKDFVEEDPYSVPNLFVFAQIMGRTNIFTPQDDLEYFEKVLADLKEKHPDNEHVLNFEERMAQIRENAALSREMEKVRESLKPGNPVPNIEMTGPDGNMHSLADLKGKVVLVDFWAAWCRPCRAENPNLVRMYNEYKGKGFDVFSVSLDGLPQQPNPKEDWTKAISDDGLSWENHVSDLQGWNSAVVRQFGFTGIPFTVLVDRDGNIIATELRGPQLEAKLKEVLGS